VAHPRRFEPPICIFGWYRYSYLNISILLLISIKLLGFNWLCNVFIFNGSHGVFQLKLFSVLSIVWYIFLNKVGQLNQNNLHSQWTIIGAGPAGTAVLGKLLDSGVDSAQIIWLDPYFQGGDFGQKWHSVSSNTTTDLFLKFLKACSSFQYQKCPIDFPINHLLPNQTCQLKYMADPLQWITNHLRQKVRSLATIAHSVTLKEGKWVIATKDVEITTQKVVLAIGAEPLSLDLPRLEVIPIEDAMDLSRLKKTCSSCDTVAVFGSSHTAVVALYNLSALGVPFINFYRSPFKYAVFYDDWVLYDNTGLKGYSAEWARKNMESMTRIHVDNPLYDQTLARCNRAIYAIGFQRRSSLKVSPYESLTYDPSSGIIGPGLFGIGIAFPQGQYDRAGNYEYRVGLWKFMDYLTEILPLWLKSPCN
jgi:hypothetical protein